GATDRALEAMRESLGKLEEKGGRPADEVLRRITVVDDLVPAALLIEAVVEDADVKEQLFRRADQELPAGAVLASNTSSIPIATVARLGFVHPLGPLALADLIGLDTCVAIMEVLQEGLGDDRYAPCPLLREHVAAGRLGRKTGSGFYPYQ